MIKEPSILMMVREDGKAQVQGFGVADPVLVCNDLTSPCVYKPAANEATGTCATGNGSTDQPYSDDGVSWVHNRGENWLFVDGHVKFRFLAPTTAAGGTDFRTDPGYQYDDPRNRLSDWYDGCHDILFRPDLSSSDIQ